MKSEDKRVEGLRPPQGEVVIWLDENLCVQACNRAAEQWYGFACTGTAGRRLDEAVGGVHASVDWPQVFRHGEEGGWRSEFHLADDADGQLWIECSLRRLEANQPGAAVFLWSVVDVSERRRLETSLRESESRYRRLVETSPDMVLLCDDSRKILYVNLAGLEILGWEDRRDIVGKQLEEIVHPSSRADVRTRLQELLDKMSQLPFVEERFLKSDQSTLHVDMMAFPFLLDGDYVMHLVVRDVTARKAMEAAQRRQRRQLLTASAFLVLVLTIVGGYKFYHFTESTEFCGKLCHSVMEPDLRLHERSSHSHVTCAECHIGAGAAWYVKAKLSGLHQVWAVAARTYSKPIPSPLANLRPATETCEFCHSPRVFHGNRSKVFRRVADQGDPMDPEVTALLLRVGGYSPGSNSYSGIHWHAGPQSKVEFRAVDRSRLQIRDIRVTRESGKVDLYSNQRLPALPEDAPWRTMDCSDCHNRVPHQYLSAEQALDRLVLDGKLNPLLPDIKRAGLDALVATYDDSQRAREGIRRRLERHYLKTRPEVVRHKTADLDRTARVLYEQAFSSNVYPRLNIGWETYPDHNGHRNELGCFRCHDGEHRSAAGATVFQDCDPCHATVVEGVRESGIPEDVRRFLSW